MEDLIIKNFKDYIDNFFSEDTIDKEEKLKSLYDSGLENQITYAALLTSLIEKQIANEDVKKVIIDLLQNFAKISTYHGQISLLYDLSKEGGVQFEQKGIKE